MRALLYLSLVMFAIGCRERQSAGLTAAGSQNWQPKGLFDPSEIINNPASNHVLLFESGRVTHFLPDGTSVWMGHYEKTNEVWIWHVFANQWKIQPDGDSMLFTELGDPKNPLLRNPTNKFHLKTRASMPDYHRVHE